MLHLVVVPQEGALQDCGSRHARSSEPGATTKITDWKSRPIRKVALALH